MKKQLKSAGLVVPFAALVSASLAQAQAPTTEELDQRIRILERQLELQKEEAETRSKESSSASASDKGFSLKNAKGDYEIRFGALVQADARGYASEVAPGAGPVDTFLFRRIEPTIQGSLGKLIGFRITPNFAPSSVTTSDIYADLKFHPTAALRVGKFKQPVGLENLQGSHALTFAERGLTINLVPNRDIGLQLSGEVAGGTTVYALGVFNGAADGADAASPDANDAKEVAARLFSEPFKNSPGLLQGLGFGVGATYGDKDFNPSGNAAEALPTYKSPGQLNIFTYDAAGVTASGTHQRLAPQLFYYHDSLGLLAEYVRSEQELTRAGNRQDLGNDAWEVTASVVLTGEDASYKGVKPAAPFTVGGPGWGAVELGLRYGVLDIDDTAFADATGTAAGSTRFADPAKQVSEAAAAGVAINWYLTQQAKLAVNYEHTRFDGGAAAGRDRSDEDIVIGRLSLNY